MWAAQFDPAAFPNPNTFRHDRPYDNYLLFGDGMHRCFGEYINKLAFPEICKAVLQLPNLRAATAPETDHTGFFPLHYALSFDA